MTILYAGFLGLPQIDIELLPFVRSPEGFKPAQRIEFLRGPEYRNVLDTYLPVKSCRFMRGEGAFRACSLHFFSEGITWMTPLKHFLPHLFLFVILCFLFSKFMCGWICPLGFLVDVFSIVRRKIKLAYIELPKNFADTLTKFKYGLLLFIILTSLLIASPIAARLGIIPFQKELFLVGCQMCPSRFIFPIFAGNLPLLPNFTTPILAIFSVISLFFLTIFLLGFFIRRFWCRICPSGALISFFNLGGAMIKEKDVLKCTKCGVCARVCPVQNKKVYEEKTIENICDKNCIRCFKCIDMCPETDCLKVKIFGKTLFRSRFQ